MGRIRLVGLTGVAACLAMAGCAPHPNGYYAVRPPYAAYLAGPGARLPGIDRERYERERFERDRFNQKRFNQERLNQERFERNRLNREQQDRDLIRERVLRQAREQPGHPLEGPAQVQVFRQALPPAPAPAPQQQTPAGSGPDPGPVVQRLP